MDGGYDVGGCGCCGDIMVGANKSPSNDCTTSANKNKLLVDNADRHDNNEWIVFGIPVVVILLSSHNETGDDANAVGIDSDKWIVS